MKVHLPGYMLQADRVMHRASPVRHDRTRYVMHGASPRRATATEHGDARCITSALAVLPKGDARCITPNSSGEQIGRSCHSPTSISVTRH